MAHTAPRKAGATFIATIFYFQLLAALGPRPAAARVDPLNHIMAQIQKPNVLIVLDTSGSFTGFPGETFSVATDEFGNECDDGINCRGGLSPGKCTITNTTCNSDAQCTSGFCNAPTTTTGPRMCRLAQVRCTRDSSCSSISGDTCGPGTSRLVMAKRAIRNVVAANANIVNLGLMTFSQSGYYPYYKVTGSSSTSTQTLISEGTLSASGCYSQSTGLTGTCIVNGKTYTLHGGANAVYNVSDHGGNDRHGGGNRGGRDSTVAYCGYFCNVSGQGKGVFKAAYYDSSNITGSTGSTATVFPTYRGKVFTHTDGFTYRYYDGKPDNYSNGLTPPISAASSCSSAPACSAVCGARWDTQLAPFLNSNSTPATNAAVVTAINQAMEPVSYGGLFANLGTPRGCALENNVLPDKNHSAYHYMVAVKAADTLSCRLNYVLFVTDGTASALGAAPGDDNCTAANCAAANPQTAGCTCTSVLAPWHMRQNLGVKTFVVGFSSEATAGNGFIVNESMAKAGGTDLGGDGAAPYSFSANSESELVTAIQGVIYQAVSGSYATSPPTASQGTITGTTERSGNILLDARIDFPTWKGHLVAYDTTTGSPVLAWDAATRLVSMGWKKRKLYTLDASKNLVLMGVDQTTGAITNKAALYTLGLGDDAEEAEDIVRWALGDPVLTNPAILGSIINSTPIDVGPPPDGTAPGQHKFYLDHLTRPSLVYVGSDDGMLHAFFTRNVTVNGVAYAAGNEAFAYLPRSMHATLTNLFAQDGQSADPAKHIYGLASSPKVKNLCVQNCNDDATAVWKTVLVMTEGWGGNGMFMLDVTDPVPASGNPFSVMWSATSTSQATAYNNDLGSSVSVPAFTVVPATSNDDQRVIMASGYPIDATSTTQGRILVSSSVQDGTMKTVKTIVPGGTTCTQDYALLTDVATSRRQLKDASGTSTGRKALLGAYFGDTWGNLWRYSADTDTADKVVASGFGCQHPLHFSPTVVQMDGDDPSNSYAGQIFLAQVTNSSLDPVTAAFATASKMVIMKETFSAGSGPQLDTTFGTSGQLVPPLCAVTTGASCTTALPANARPLATPTGIIKPDGSGFVLMSSWFLPANACVKGKTYLNIHDVSGSSVTLKQAFEVDPDEPVLNPIIVNGALMVSTSTGPRTIASTLIQVENAIAPSIGGGGDPFQMSGWTEIQ